MMQSYMYATPHHTLGASRLPLLTLQPGMEQAVTHTGQQGCPVAARQKAAKSSHEMLISAPPTDCHPALAGMLVGQHMTSQGQAGWAQDARKACGSTPP